VLASNLNELRKSRRLIGCHLRELTAINFDASALKALNKTVVSQSVFAGRSVDALDPQKA
jgi:hypothetical protein